MKMKTSFLLATVAGLVVLLTACGPDAAEPAAADSALETATEHLLLAEVPASVPGVVEAIANAEAGESFVFTGRVGGRTDPLSSDFAVFLLADESLQFCDEMGDEHCRSPWDACCEDPAKLKASITVVQFVDESGDPLPLDLGKTLGLAANDNLVIKGHFAPESSPRNPIINAEGLAIQR